MTSFELIYIPIVLLIFTLFQIFIYIKESRFYFLIFGIWFVCSIFCLFFLFQLIPAICKSIVILAGEGA
jgi:hypothetical protein